MNPLTEQVERGAELLIQASEDLDTSVRLWAGEEELLIWHLAEMVYDFKYIETHLSEGVGGHDHASALTWVHQHCGNVMYSMVFHWRGHMEVLRERMNVCRAAHPQGDASRSGPGNNEESSLPASAARDAMAGIDALQIALRPFTTWLVEENIVDSGLAGSMFDFVTDLRALHERLLRILPLRRFETLASALLAYCDEVDTMLIRWDAYATRLGDYLDTDAPESSPSEDGE